MGAIAAAMLGANHLEATMRCKDILILIVFTLLLIPASTAAQAQQWVELGCREVNFTVDRDVIPVNARGLLFRAIHLRVGAAPVEMLDLKVIYGNGAPDDIPVRSRFAAGSSSGPLDLAGRDRAIQRIELVYASRPTFRGRARVCVDGVAVAGPHWVELGCREVDFKVDRDVVRVGRREGRFTSIRLRATENVRMLDVKVVYGSGEPDDIPVRANIPAGGTGPLDLRGADRVIDRIELLYERKPEFRRRARVCVDGRTG
jgi:hypothetical protein